MKMNRLKLSLILFLILSVEESFIISTNSNTEESLEKKMEIENKKEDYYNTDGRNSLNNSNSQYVIPRVKRDPDYIVHHSIVRTNVPVTSHTTIHSADPIPAINNLPNPCPCAAQVRCKPCSVIVTNMVPDLYPQVHCPCAPKCPVCPPLSLLHEIASKKAEQDQQLAYNLKSLAGRISKYFDLVIKYSGDVVKFEKEAKEAAKKMEEASIKSQFARKNMFNTSEKARFIAKTSIVDNRPCGGLPCNLNPNANPPNMFGYYSDKVFPEEVDNIKEYMRDNFSTNVNGFTDENGGDLMNEEGSDGSSRGDNGIKYNRHGNVIIDERDRGEYRDNNMNNNMSNNINDNLDNREIRGEEIENSPDSHNNRNPDRHRKSIAYNQNEDMNNQRENQNENQNFNHDQDQNQTASASSTVNHPNNHRILRRLR